MACLVSRHPLVDTLGIKGVKIFNEPYRFQLNRVGLTQYYYNKSSFLDLTSDIDVAKFFATCDYDNTIDSYKPHAPNGKFTFMTCDFPESFSALHCHNYRQSASNISKKCHAVWLFTEYASKSKSTRFEECVSDLF